MKIITHRLPMLLGAMLLAAMVSPPGVLGRSPDPKAGMMVFREKGCSGCHSVLGEGGKLGPDLSKTPSTNNSLELATAMWSHAPQMWQRMQQEHFQLPIFTAEEMADLFSFLAMSRSFDEPGNAAAGQLVFQSKGCSDCHAIRGQGARIGPDLASVASLRNPVAWVAGMWNHAPGMFRALREKSRDFPQFHGTEMVDLQSYIRLRAGGMEQDRSYLRPPSADQGAALFRSKQCVQCHGVDGRAGKIGPDLSRVVLPKRYGEIAAFMWNHAPQMNRQAAAASIPYPRLEAWELADILAYLDSLSMRWIGNPVTGAATFANKGCTLCHAITPGEKSPGPNLTALQQQLTPVTVATIMWNHGPRMLQRMESSSIPWPIFNSRELADTISFLESLQRRPFQAGHSTTPGEKP
ncbi:MAG: c-type cytochrome [Acidobacteria bacterium]|nr:c-type cytochrome [Acidobacteriota bacterium]